MHLPCLYTHGHAHAQKSAKFALCMCCGTQAAACSKCTYTLSRDLATVFDAASPRVRELAAAAGPHRSPTQAQRVPGPWQPEVVGAHQRHCFRTRFQPCFGRCGMAHCRAPKWCLLESSQWARAAGGKLARSALIAESSYALSRSRVVRAVVTQCRLSLRTSGPRAAAHAVNSRKLCTYLQRCALGTRASTTLHFANTCISRHVRSGPRACTLCTTAEYLAHPPAARCRLLREASVTSSDRTALLHFACFS